MKKLTKNFSFFLLFFFIVLNVQGQEMYGFLYDKDGNPIKGEEVMLEIIICKNGDELFTKTETVMTDNTFGAFSSDLTIEFGTHGAEPGDKIEFSLKFTHGGETITTEKKLWPVVLMSNASLASEVSSHSLIADHALTADESTHALNADMAMTAQNAQNAVLALTANEAMNAITADNALHAVMADAASTASQADFATSAEHANTADEAILSNSTVNYVPIQNALPNDGDRGILVAENSGGTVNFSNLPPSNQSTGIDILSSSSGTFTFTNISSPPGTTTFFTVQNTGSQSMPVALTFDDSLEGNLGIKSDGNGGNSIVTNPLLNAFDASQANTTYNILNLGNNSAMLVPNYFDTDTSSDVTTILTPSGQFNAIGPNTSARLNFQNAYGGMFTGAVCADYYVENRSPLLANIESEKSLSQLDKNNTLWQASSGKNDHGFVASIESMYPELVQDISIEINGKETTEKYVHYTALIPLLSKAIKEQSDIINSQQKEIDTLKKLVESLIENSKKISMKNLLFILVFFPVFGFSQTAYLMQDANVQVAEGNTFNVISYMNNAPVDVVEGASFTVLVSQMPAPYTGITTSVEYIDEKLTSVKVYPNPFTGLVHVNLDLESRENLRFQIINLNGMMIKTFKEDNAFGHIKKLFYLDDLPSGQYVLVVTDENHDVLSRVKVVKLR